MSDRDVLLVWYYVYIELSIRGLDAINKINRLSINSISTRNP